VQEELDDARARMFERSLEPGDQVVARTPDLLRHEPVNANHEHVLVVRAVEDHDLSVARHLAVHAPQEVVGQVLLRRGLEALDTDALWVEPAEDLADRTVLAAGVHRLQYDEQCLPRLGPEPRLQFRELLAQRMGGGLGRGLVARRPRLRRWVDAG
jgi:hypothetical protein